VPVRIGSGLSTAPDTRTAAVEAARAAAAGLGGASCDVALLFASGSHLAAPEAALEGVHDVLAPAELAGCGAAGVIGGDREIEDGTAVVVWAAHLDGGDAVAFHLAGPGEDEDGPTEVPDLAGASAAVLLPDSSTYPTDPVLQVLAAEAPEVPLLGGVASARTPYNTAALFIGDEVVDGGAVGIRFDGVEILPCVSQGAAPIGPELTITAGDGGVIEELAGRPALEKLRDTVAELPEAERQLLEQGLLLGIVVDHNKPDYVHGDFLVRGIVGADPDSGRIAIGTRVRPGQVVRLHARDAESADRDLRRVLSERRTALGGEAAGALLFACNGRGRGMFGTADHDAITVADTLGGAPAAGFFAAGEIGPVGGHAFLHGFTATLAVFRA
jgi:small ligand-binding sensory domain FIST